MKVICTHKKKRGTIFDDSINKLKVDGIYTVIGSNEDSFLLSEVKSSHPNGMFNKERFREIDTDWVDELLENLNTEELVNVC